MISISGLDQIKALAEVEVEIIPGGILFVYTEKDTIQWRKASSTLNLDIFNIGEKIKSDSIAAKAMNEKKTIKQSTPRSLYGSRFDIVGIPVVDEEDQVVGAFSILIPKLHPVVKSFKDFAPIIAEMFPEGAVLFLTDLDKILSKQSSNKFDVSFLQKGDILKDNSIASNTIGQGKPIIEELESSIYGVNVLEACYPMYDEDTKDIVGTLTIITPKETAVKLRDMSNNLGNNLTGIAAAIEELAASASQIHINEQELNTEIKEITKLSEEINEVSSFIKEIADETKMLGLNAAIEAARAGDAGKGFGVVAEEIRNLSQQSKSTVPKINKLANDIIAKVNEVSEKSMSSLASSEEQASATEEITASIEEITSSTEELSNIAKKL